jgi:hypothetical protein
MAKISIYVKELLDQIEQGTNTLIKKKIKFSSYSIRKFAMEQQLQSHI